MTKGKKQLSLYLNNGHGDWQVSDPRCVVLNGRSDLRLTAGMIWCQLIADLSVNWTTRRWNGDAVVEECCASAALNRPLDLIDGLTVQLGHLTTGPQAIPALVSSLLNVLIVDEHEDCEKDLENDNGQKAQRVEIQQAFWWWNWWALGNLKTFMTTHVTREWLRSIRRMRWRTPKRRARWWLPGRIPDDLRHQTHASRHRFSSKRCHRRPPKQCRRPETWQKYENMLRPLIKCRLTRHVTFWWHSPGCKLKIDEPPIKCLTCRKDHATTSVH